MKIKLRLIYFLAVLSMGFGFTAAAENALTWQDCVREAAKKHPDLISAQETISQSKDTKWETESALLPQADGTLGMSRQQSGSTSANKPSNSYSYAVSGSQLIYDGFKTIHDIQADTEGVKAAREAYRFVSSDVRYGLRSAYIESLTAQEAIDLYDDIIEIRKSNHELIKLRYESGTEHKGALMQAEANLAQAEYDLSQAKRAVVVSRRKLAQEMGNIGFTDFHVNGDMAVNEPYFEKPDLIGIASQHPSVMQLMMEKEQADYKVKSAISSFYPSVTAQAGAGKTDSDWPPHNNKWNLGLTVSYPLFEGGLRLAQLAKAKSVLRKTEADEQSTFDATVSGLETAWADLQDSAEYITVQEKFVASSEERYKIAEEQYSIGIMSYDNLIIIEDDLVTAKKQLLNIKASALLAEANWIRAKGETLEYEKY